MIRDPSDGSVRPPLSEDLIEAVKREAKKPKGPALDHEPTRKFMAGEYDTGIRQPVRTDAQERLERSREWLKNYHASKHGGKPDDLVRRDHESELPSQG